MTADLLFAIDGGNSKTDLVLFRSDGTVLAAVRGPGSSQHHLGIDVAMDRIDALFRRATAAAGVPDDRPGDRPRFATFALAGADLPHEEAALAQAVADRGWAADSMVINDTFALLRSGTDRGWGVAVVCGSGINCVGSGPDGETVRFPALGSVSGDWGGGWDVGLAGLTAAVRSEDGRGTPSALARSVPVHFGLRSAAEVSEALYLESVPESRLWELAPVVFAAAAAGDRAAGEIVDRQAGEVVAFAAAALRRLGLTRTDVDVVLGGGLLRAGQARLDARVRAGIHAVAPRCRIVVVDDDPVVGAGLLALDASGAAARAAARLRAGYRAAVRREGTSVGSAAHLAGKGRDGQHAVADRDSRAAGQ